MVVQEIRCSMCGNTFEAKVLDRDDPQERDVYGSSLRCPKCNSVMLNVVRTIRRAERRAS
jgi:DNA-directed RNA polymerase subunit RPC12/RpoP